MTHRILIADDNPDDANLLEQALRTKSTADLAIHTAADGERAIEAIDGTQLDLLVLDLYLPRYDAGDLLQKLRDLDRQPKCPVVVLSSYPPPSLRETLLAGGVTAILEKPPEWDGYLELAEILLALLRKRSEFPEAL